MGDHHGVRRGLRGEFLVEVGHVGLGGGGGRLELGLVLLRQDALKVVDSQKATLLQLVSACLIIDKAMISYVIPWVRSTIKKPDKTNNNEFLTSGSGAFAGRDLAVEQASDQVSRILGQLPTAHRKLKNSVKG